ncbi:MAG: SemiSWEET family transporter [Chloroflexota bacterium]
MVEYLGFAGGLITTISYIPQLIRVFKLRSAREISVLFTIFLLIGMAVWLFYGIFLSLVPVILWNAIGVVLTSILLYGKLKYGFGPKK